MKLRNLLLVALFLSTGIVFAKPDKDKPKDKDKTETYEKLSWNTSDDTVKVSMLMGNSGWTSMYLGAYSSTGALLGKVKLIEAPKARLTQDQVDALLEQTDLNNNQINNIKDFKNVSKHPAYSFAVPLSAFDLEEGDTIASFGLIGTNGKKEEEGLAYSFDGTDVKGQTEGKNTLHFSSVPNDSSVLAFSKSKWVETEKFQNGNLFLIDMAPDGLTYTIGNPLPAPVVTLLIALAFGGAFVMYRNRKQAKA